MARYLMPKASNSLTGEIRPCILGSALFIPLHDVERADMVAAKWAIRLTEETGEEWWPLVEEYVTLDRTGKPRLRDL